ncbi:MAG: DUF3108 domain-containing protein [Bacteroidetes bacterium]|jgi:Protein of unknown function (DUF3108)|uniref:DUF3108 domain-containing protein n=1 Tax=Phnomibacter sp. TaxID=2836217 RepID=UPI002FDDF694|nr:DUF3108 domain-containing protein [Bacteroidota bacterium]
MKKLLIAGILLLAFAPKASTEGSCNTKNKAFKHGEKVIFHVYYTVAGLWVHAGNVSFTATLSMLNNKPAYHVVADGSTLSSYDWIYRVRDRYETYIDTATLLPQKFIRNVDEGGYKIYENVTFYHDKKTAVTNQGVFTIPSCAQDVLSEVYLARNMDFNKLKPGEMLPFDLFLDNKVYNMYVRYLGKETIKTRYGKFRCIKFKPLLLKGSIFEGGEKMTVWVTDDGNRLPVRIESPITVGSIKVDMMSYYNLRYPLTSLIDIR